MTHGGFTVPGGGPIIHLTLFIPILTPPGLSGLVSGSSWVLSGVTGDIATGTIMTSMCTQATMDIHITARLVHSEAQRKADAHPVPPP